MILLAEGSGLTDQELSKSQDAPVEFTLSDPINREPELSVEQTMIRMLHSELANYRALVYELKREIEHGRPPF